MAELVIIHFSAIELYPPVQNLIIELSKKEMSKALILTTSNGSVRKFASPHSRIEIRRLVNLDRRKHVLVRLLRYLSFHFESLILLILNNPKRLLYFETLSSFPAYLYKRFIKRSVKIFIHYHEYTSPEEYETGMKLTRYFHRLEKYLFKNAVWISHTNGFRMDLFKKDNLNGVTSPVFILPNFPPKSWHYEPKASFSKPLKVVYVGSLSLKTMYAREFSNWIVSQKGEVTLDLYSHNYDEEVKMYFSSLGSKWIVLKEGVVYNTLPLILKNYDVGVIFYNGHIPNYVYNAPNKLFEYLVCGLDVWVSNEMTGCKPYLSSSVPKVVEINFNHLESFDLTNNIKRTGIKREHSFFCEDALVPLISKLRGS